MKKLTLLAVALLMAVNSFAGAYFYYYLNGGKENEWGWENPQDMYEALNADWNAFSDSTSIWTPLDDLKLSADPVRTGIPNEAEMTTSFLNDANFIEHFQWLIDYMDAKCEENGSYLLPSSSNISLRYNLATFFVDSKYDSWPNTADYTNYGVSTLSAYQSYWKASFSNPRYVSDSILLNPAYRESYVFGGWYDNANFDGEPVTHVSSQSSKQVLYAKWLAPTLAEVNALPDETFTSAAGIVTFISGNNFWIQDNTAAMLCYYSNHNLNIGDSIVLEGTKNTRYGNPELKASEIISVTLGTPIVPQTIFISDILSDSQDEYFYELIKLESVMVKYHGSYTYLSDGIDSIELYNVILDEKVYPHNARVEAIAIVSAYNEKKELRSNVANITLVEPSKDPYIYPEVTVGEQTYNLQNNWMYSVYLDNWNSARPNLIQGGTHSVCENEGILYFPYYSSTTPTRKPYLARVDAATGKILTPIMFAENIFKDANGEWMTGPYADMKKDAAGNLIVSNSTTDGEDFQVWNIDPITGKGTLLIDQTGKGATLKDYFPTASAKIQIERISVYGDITQDAIIMAASANSTEVYYWRIIDGKWNGRAEIIKLSLTEHLGESPIIYPIAENLFYIDGNATYPILFEITGNVVDNMTNYPTLLNNLYGEKRSTKNNGLVEFEVNGKYYLLCAGGSSESSQPSTFVLYQFKDENRSFGEMTQLYEFSHSGMGSALNLEYVAVPLVKVAENKKSVDIYVFTAENGYGSYSLYLGNAPTNVESISLNHTEAIINKAETLQLEATILPYIVYDESVRWSSENTEIATVDSSGLVTAHNKGTTNILVTSVEGGKMATCQITVISKVIGIALDTNIVTLAPKTTINLTATVLPLDADNQNFSWSSSNTEVAIVSNGRVLSLNAGQAVIRVTTEDGGFTDSCIVNVEIPVESILLNPSSLTLNIGGAEQLIATILPEEATNKNYTLVSDNENVASIMEGGWVIAGEMGIAYITATTENSYKTAICRVVVGNVQESLISDIIINPGETTAEFSWPALKNALSYVFIIYADAAKTEKICTLTFDDRGYLVRIDFIRNKPSSTRESNRPFNFIVTGLEPATTYAYTLDSYGDENTILNRRIGNFTTTGGVLSSVENISVESNSAHKVIENGTIYILRNGEKYTVDGRKVSTM